MKSANSFLHWVALGLLWSTLSVADGIPEGYESYSERPAIESVSARAQSSLAPHWKELRRGHLETVVQLVELYPDRDLYFLARDSELLFDAARLIYADQPSILARLHLLNVSRSNAEDPNLSAYLSQEGLSVREFRKGKKVLIVDTGFAGTIPKKIQSLFPSLRKEAFLTHLLCSASEEYPSSRAFLASLNPAAPRLDPGTMHGTVIGYEHLPRYTERSEFFARARNRWHAVSPIHRKLNDGQVDRLLSIRYMEDLKRYLHSDEARRIVLRRKTQYRRLVKAESDSKSLREIYLSLLRDDKSDPYVEALVRDHLETLARNGSAMSRPALLTLEDLGLPAVTIKSRVSKQDVIQKYPKFAPYLLNPEVTIPQAVQKGDLAELGALFDVYADEEIAQIFVNALPQPPAKFDVDAYIVALMKSPFPMLNNRLIQHVSLEPERWKIETVGEVLRLGEWSVQNKILQAIADGTIREGASELLLIGAESGQSLFTILELITGPGFERFDPGTRVRIVESIVHHAFDSLNPSRNKDFFNRLKIELVRNTFTHESMANLTSPIRLFLERIENPSDLILMELISRRLEPLSWTKSPPYLLLRDACRIEDAVSRRKFLKAGFDRLSPFLPHSLKCPLLLGPLTIH